ncbi:hypothetical protein D047_1445A, partial [Vibrio parahaemolyticus VPTS-2010_2]
MIKYRREVEV